MQIEICTNDEFICQMLDWDVDKHEEVTSIEASNAYFNEAFLFLENNGYSYENIVSAQGQRILYHGWNGSQFEYKVGGIGTFMVLKVDKQNILDHAHYAGLEAAQSVIDNWVSSLENIQ